MQKITLLLVVSTVLVTGFLSGCDETELKDTDGDGRPDETDVFPNDITEWADADNDGTGDNSDEFPTNDTEWSDTDGDGYGDNTDDLPTDSNVHKKIVIVDSYDTYFSNPEMGHTSNGSSFTVEQDSKYVVVDWSVMHSLRPDEYHKILFFISSPSGRENFTYSPSNCSLQFTVDASNWGSWEYEFSVEQVTQNITIDRKIYVLK